MKKATREDKIDEMDERNQLIKLKSKAKSLNILLCILVVIMTIGIIAYIMTKVITWSLLILIPVVLITIYWVTYIGIYLYCEKHE